MCVSLFCGTLVVELERVKHIVLFSDILFFPIGLFPQPVAIVVVIVIIVIVFLLKINTFRKSPPRIPSEPIPPIELCSVAVVQGGCKTAAHIGYILSVAMQTLAICVSLFNAWCLVKTGNQRRLYVFAR